MRARALALGLACVPAFACGTSSPPQPAVVACVSTAPATPVDTFTLGEVGVYVDSPDPILDPVRVDLAAYLGKMWGGAVPVATTPPDGSKRLSLWISSGDAARAKTGTSILDGYLLDRIDDPSGKTTIVVYARDAADLASGAYALLEELGARFFHPEQELVPSFGAPRIPHTLDAWRRPLARRRGVQPHTLHPIEYLATFVEPGGAHLAEAKRFVDWLVKTGQNYVRWPLLATVDWKGYVPYAQAIVEYAHGRGVRVGASVEIWGGSALQNNYVLVSDAAGAQTEIAAGLDRLLDVPWDVVDLTMGEFVAAGPQSIIDWLDDATAYVLAKSPSTEVNVENHVGNYPQLWVQYRGQTVFYYHLPQYCDARLGQSVHTLSLFDLYRDWATYGHPSFHLQHDYLLQELAAGRRVAYFPESAYWISADVDVPLFLPEHLYARWLDIHQLSQETADRGLPPLEGHIEFTSGHEWGYWLNDYLVAEMLWRPDDSLDSLIARALAPFGNCAADVASALSSYVDLQTQYLFDQRLLAYVQGENATVDLGYLAGLETHPKRLEFEQVLAMSEGDRASFRSNVLGGLDAFAARSQPIEDALAARCRGADDALAPWCDELWDGVEIVRLRAQHAALLYRSILAYAGGDGGGAASLLSQAQGVTAQAAQVVARRESHYRFDLARETADYANPTVYPFGYLHEAHTLCYWTRREEQVRFLLANGVAEGIPGLPRCQGE